MSIFFEIAYAAVNKGLCIFTGTGFSKAVSKNAAPTWQGLLEALCDKCANPDKLKAALFPENEMRPLSLEEAAQVIEIELLKDGKKIHHEIAAIIEKVELGGERGAVEDFSKSRHFRSLPPIMISWLSNWRGKLIVSLSRQGCQFQDLILALK